MTPEAEQRRAAEIRAVVGRDVEHEVVQVDIGHIFLRLSILWKGLVRHLNDISVLFAV